MVVTVIMCMIRIKSEWKKNVGVCITYPVFIIDSSWWERVYTLFIDKINKNRSITNKLKFRTLFSWSVSICFYFSVEQFLVFVVAANFDPFIPRLWTFCESRHPCGMGPNDCRRFEFSIFSRHTQSYRSITRWTGYFVGLCGRILVILPEEIFSTMFKWKPVILKEDLIFFL